MITYQVLARYTEPESTECIFWSKTYKPALKEFNDIISLYDGEDFIDLVKDYGDGSSDILKSKANPPATKGAKEKWIII
jgi:hypothetical protein